MVDYGARFGGDEDDLVAGHVDEDLERAMLSSIVKFGKSASAICMVPPWAVWSVAVVAMCSCWA